MAMYDVLEENENYGSPFEPFKPGDKVLAFGTLKGKVPTREEWGFKAPYGWAVPVVLKAADGTIAFVHHTDLVRR